MSIQLAAGMRLTPQRLNDLSPYVARKTVDQSVTNSTTLVDDLELQISVTANYEYDVEATIFYSSDTTGDFRHAFTWPSGSFPWGEIGLDTGATTTAGNVRPVAFANPSSGSSFFQVAGAGSTNVMVLYIKGSLIVGSTGGLLKFQFAQNTATAGQSAVCRAGSKLKIVRVN